MPNSQPWNLSLIANLLVVLTHLCQCCVELVLGSPRTGSRGERRKGRMEWERVRNRRQQNSQRKGKGVCACKALLPIGFLWNCKSFWTPWLNQPQERSPSPCCMGGIWPGGKKGRNGPAGIYRPWKRFWWMVSTLGLLVTHPHPVLHSWGETSTPSVVTPIWAVWYSSRQPFSPTSNPGEFPPAPPDTCSVPICASLSPKEFVV